MFNKIVAGVSLALALSATAHAGVYKMGENAVSLEIKGANIVGKSCFMVEKKERCLEANMKTEDFLKGLEERVELFKEATSNKDVLLKNIKLEAGKKDIEVIEDKASGKSFKMISLVEGNFMMPYDVELIKKGDFDMIVSVLMDHVEKMQGIVDLVKSGKLPSDFEVDENEYEKFEPVNSLFFELLKSYRDANSIQATPEA